MFFIFFFTISGKRVVHWIGTSLFILGGWLGKVDRHHFESKHAYIYFMFWRLYWALFWAPTSWVLTNVAESFSLFFFLGLRFYFIDGMETKALVVNIYHNISFGRDLLKITHL